MQRSPQKYYKHAEVENNFLTGIKYLNPFPAFKKRQFGVVMTAKFFYGNLTTQIKSEELKDILPDKVIEPESLINKEGVLRAVWIGHATVLIQDGPVNIITDPIFHSKVPDAFYGYKRMAPLPIELHQIPKIHAVVVSHDHHDHCNTDILNQIHERFDAEFFIGKQSCDLFPKKAKDKVHEMNWTECVEFTAENRKYKIHFVPACHWSGRSVTDHFKRLWGGFVIETPENRKIYYAGDTGYCEVFKEIGEHFGSIDLALLPIGAYMPREFLCYQHIDPEEAVKVHQEVRAKQSLGIHWATFQLACQKFLQPKEELEAALVKHHVKDEEFICFFPGNILTCDIPVLRPMFQTTETKKFTWLGHSTLVFQLQGVNILVNPVFSNKLHARDRYTECPCKVKDLPTIDIILVSHLLSEDELNHPKLSSVPLLTNKQIKSQNLLSEKTWGKKHVTIEMVEYKNTSSFVIKSGVVSYVICEDLELHQSPAEQPTFLFLPIRHFANGSFSMESFESKYHSLKPEVVVPVNWGSFEYKEESIVQPVVDIKNLASKLEGPRLMVPVIGKSVSF